MTIVDQTISTQAKLEEFYKKRNDLIKKRKTEGKKYKVSVDYSIRMHEIGRHFEFNALNEEDLEDQLFEKIADDHNVEECDIDLDDTVISSIDNIEPPVPISCPACGSADVDTREEQATIGVPFGPEVAYQRVVNTCRACGSNGDFEHRNENALNTALHESQGASAKFMVDSLTNSKTGFPALSPAYIERALRLRSGYLKLWHMGTISEVGLSLLRIIYTHPWLLQISDANFDGQTMKKVFETVQKSWKISNDSSSSLSPIPHIPEANVPCAGNADKPESASAKSEA